MTFIPSSAQQSSAQPTDVVSAASVAAASITPALQMPALQMPALQMTGVNKVFGDGDGQITALYPTDFEVRPGELVAVIGPSGSGKSTLLTLAGALQMPTAGKIKIAGVELTSLRDRDLPKFRLDHIGFVLQGANLIPYLTVREQLTLIAELTGGNKRKAGALAASGIGSFGPSSMGASSSSATATNRSSSASSSCWISRSIFSELGPNFCFCSLAIRTRSA